MASAINKKVEINSSALKLSIRHNVRDHPEVEINGVLYIKKQLLNQAQKEIDSYRSNIMELVEENMLSRSWIDFYLGLGPKPQEKLSWMK